MLEQSRHMTLLAPDARAIYFACLRAPARVLREAAPAQACECARGPCQHTRWQLERARVRS
eukprot:9522574-Lingulodinium_polyedra.AAC.1